MKPEESFQSAVVEMAHLYGWKVALFRKARTKTGWVTAVGADGKGWLDLFLAHDGLQKIIFVELKVPPNTCTPEQIGWLQYLIRCCEDARVWTPNDWDEIEDTLSGRSL
jgi:hypothetical protein